jgi:2-methylcitrate dehydratase
MTAVGLIFGELKAEHYEDHFASDPRIDELRSKMKVTEDERYSKDYHDPEKRSIANAIQIEFDDGSKTDKIEIEYPLGHRRRRAEAIPEIVKKFKHNMATHYTQRQLHKVMCLIAELNCS